MRLPRLRPLATAALAALASVAPAFADFVRLDALDTLPTGTINATTSGGLWARTGTATNSVFEVATVDNQKVIAWQGGAGSGNFITRNLPAGVSSGTVTFFFRFKPVSGTTFDHAFGITSAAGVPYGGYNVQAGIAQGNIASNCDLTNRPAAAPVVTVNDTPRDQWYNMWMVLNVGTLTYDTYVTTGFRSATTADRVLTGAGFRSTVLPLTRVMITCNVTTGLPALNGNISHIVYDDSGANLANPITTGATADSDLDTLPDVWEFLNFGSLSNNASGDPDGDSYINSVEYAAGSNPNVFDAQAFPNPTLTRTVPDTAYLANTSVSLSVAATGLGNLTYQWSKDGSPLVGETNPTLALGVVDDSDEGSYSVAVTDDRAVAFGFPATTSTATTVVSVLTEAEALLAHYRFEEGSNGAEISFSSPDSVGGNDLSVTSPIYFSSTVASATLIRSGVANTLSADFSNQTLIPAGRGFAAATSGPLASDTLGNFTIEAYVRFTGLAGFQTFVGRDDDGNPGQGTGPESFFYFQKNSGNVFRAVAINRSGALVNCVSTFTPVINTWYHVAAVGNAAAGTLNLYVNGTLAGTATGFNGLYVPSSGSNTPWTIGRGQYSGTPGDYFNGQIDEVRFHKVALLPSQFVTAEATGLPSFATHPESYSRTVGQSVTFTASASGDPAPTLQWQRSTNGGANWTDISGQTSPTYTISAVTYADNAQYRVVATNVSGTASSNAATLTVSYPAPVITSAPIARTIPVNGSASFTVAATGLGTLTYQWYKDEVLIPGETAATLSLSGVAAAGGGIYSVIVSDQAAVVDGQPATTATTSARLVVIDVAPASRAISFNFVGAASNATWAADLGTLAPTDAAGFLPVANWNNSATATAVSNSVVWVPLVENNGSASGASVRWDSTNTWAARATGGTAASKTPDKRLFHGYTETRATTRLGATVVTFNNIPYTTYDVYVYVAGGAQGAVARASISDAGNTTFFYKVYCHDAFVATAEIPFIVGASATLEDAQNVATPASTFVRFGAQSGRSFTLTVADAVSTANAGGIAAVSIVDTTSALVAYPPSASVSPASLLRKAGETAAFTASASARNGGTLSYKWFKDSVEIGGQTSSTLSLSALTSASTGRYAVEVTETSSLGTSVTTAAGDLVVLDAARPILINADIKLSSGVTFAGNGILRPSDPYQFDNDGQIGAGSVSWNRVIGATGNASRPLLTESSGLAVPGLTFSWTGSAGVEENIEVASGFPALTPIETYNAGGGDLLRDYIFTTTTTPIVCTVGGLQQFAGHKVKLLVYAIGRRGYLQLADGLEDAATVTLAGVNNYLSTPAQLTSNIEGRDLAYNNLGRVTPAAYVVFDGMVSNEGTVSWNIGPDAGIDAIRAALDGFQLLITNEIQEVPAGIASQPTPATRTVISGSTVTYNVGVTGSPAPAIQWEKSTNSGTSWDPIPGATSSTLTLAQVGASATASYRAVVTSGATVLTSDAVALTVEVVGDLDNNGASDGPVLVGSDPLDLHSWTTGLNWSDGLAPVAGKSYVVSSFSLRTPPSGTTTFPGDRLILTTSSGATGFLVWKTNDPVTIPLLQMHGGTVNHAATGGATVQLNGAITVSAPSTLWANNGSITVNSTVSGTAQLNLTGNNGASNVVTFAGPVTSTGNIDIAGNTRLVIGATGSLKFTLGASGTNNAITGAGPATLDGTFVIDTTSAANTVGASWSLLTNVGARTYGATFTVAGYTPDAGAVGVRKWTSGVYQFDEATGVVSVTAVPLTQIQNWRVLYFGVSGNVGAGADDQDPDSDGYVNILEYGLGTNPLVSGGGPILAVNGSNVLTLTFNHPGDASLTYTVLAGSDPASMTAVQTYTGLSTAGSVVYQDTVPLVAGARRFLKIQVTAP